MCQCVKCVCVWVCVCARVQQDAAVKEQTLPIHSPQQTKAKAKVSIYSTKPGPPPSIGTYAALCKCQKRARIQMLL